eukprot:scaffold7.g3609.t1
MGEVNSKSSFTDLFDEVDQSAAPEDAPDDAYFCEEAEQLEFPCGSCSFGWPPAHAPAPPGGGAASPPPLGPATPARSGSPGPAAGESDGGCSMDAAGGERGGSDGERGPPWRAGAGFGGLLTPLKPLKCRTSLPH